MAICVCGNVLKINRSDGIVIPESMLSTGVAVKISFTGVYCPISFSKYYQ
jgi:hypothetical protein